MFNSTRERGWWTATLAIMTVAVILGGASSLCGETEIIYLSGTIQEIDFGSGSFSYLSVDDSLVGINF